VRERLGISIILLIALFALVPSFFAEGGLLSVKGYEYDPMVGKYTYIDGIYWDNSYFLLLTLLLSWIGFVLPFILPKIGRIWAFISYSFGGWFFSGLLYEIFNLYIPEIVLNSSEDRTLWTKFLIAFILASGTVIARETWQKSTR